MTWAGVDHKRVCPKQNQLLNINSLVVSLACAIGPGKDVSVRVLQFAVMLANTTWANTV